MVPLRNQLLAPSNTERRHSRSRKVSRAVASDKIDNIMKINRHAGLRHHAVTFKNHLKKNQTSDIIFCKRIVPYPGLLTQKNINCFFEGNRTHISILFF